MFSKLGMKMGQKNNAFQIAFVFSDALYTPSCSYLCKEKDKNNPRFFYISKHAQWETPAELRISKAKWIIPKPRSFIKISELEGLNLACVKAELSMASRGF